MNLKEILIVSGKSGLFKLISKGNNNIIVESIIDKTRMPLFASSRASSLNDICIFTIEEDIPLVKVFENIYTKENGGKCIDASKSNPNELKLYMESILPNYDKDRVHVSDMKKLFSWYNLLLENNILSFEQETAKENDSQQE